MDRSPATPVDLGTMPASPPQPLPGPAASARPAPPHLEDNVIVDDEALLAAIALVLKHDQRLALQDRECQARWIELRDQLAPEQWRAALWHAEAATERERVLVRVLVRWAFEQGRACVHPRGTGDEREAPDLDHVVLLDPTRLAEAIDHLFLNDPDDHEAARTVRQLGEDLRAAAPEAVWAIYFKLDNARGDREADAQITLVHWAWAQGFKAGVAAGRRSGGRR